MNINKKIRETIASVTNRNIVINKGNTNQVIEIAGINRKFFVGRAGDLTDDLKSLVREIKSAALSQGVQLMVNNINIEQPSTPSVVEGLPNLEELEKEIASEYDDEVEPDIKQPHVEAPVELTQHIKEILNLDRNSRLMLFCETLKPSEMDNLIQDLQSAKTKQIETETLAIAERIQNNGVDVNVLLSLLGLEPKQPEKQPKTETPTPIKVVRPTDAIRKAYLAFFTKALEKDPTITVGKVKEEMRAAGLAEVTYSNKQNYLTVAKRELAKKA